jgi:hypothetical protein
MTYMYNVCFAFYIKLNFLILVLTNQYKGAQALECLAFIAFLVTVVVIVLKLFVMKDKPILHIVMPLGNFIAGKLLI